MRFRFLTLTLTLVVVAINMPLSLASAQGGVGEWLDSVTDSTETKYKKQRLEEERLRREQEELEWRMNLERQGPPRQQAVPQVVEVFVASQCAECEATERLLTQLGVRYTRRDLEKDRAAEQEYRNSFGRGVLPVTRIGSTTVRGYEPDQIRELLGRPRLDPGFGAQRREPSNPQPSANDSWSASPSPQLPPPAKNDGYIPYDRGEYDAQKPLGAITN